MPLHHRPKSGQARKQRRWNAQDAADKRKCCSSTWREPHLATCLSRPPFCADKIGYGRRSVAERAAATQAPSFGLLSEYRCPHCGLYHIGHPRAGERRWDEAGA